MNAPTLEDIRQAQNRIRTHAIRTPLLETPRLNDRCGGRVLVKAEPLQTTGSFKIRGALNAISQLSDEEKRSGVIAYSSGNHAQAVSYAARLHGSKAVIVMPEDAPVVKVQRTKAYGGEVVMYDRYSEDRVAVAEQLAADRGLTMIAPFDNLRVIAGQGTLGLEVVEQAAEKDAVLDAFLVCCSGGGLTAGCALAFDATSPGTDIVAVEPEDFDDTRRSLLAGKRVSNSPESRSICDAVLVEMPGELTFPINQKLLTDVLVVSDEEALAAVAYASDELKITVEPGGAVALAAVLAGKIETQDRNIGLVCSGGNVDPEILRRALGGS